jgi:hypothetical protein
VYVYSRSTVLHSRHCHLLQLTRCMTTQISDISRSAGDYAYKASFRPKTPTLSSSESISPSSSDSATQFHTDVDASDKNAASDIANAMKPFQMASTGKRKSALHCTTLYCTVLHCTTALYNLRHYTTLHYTSPHFTAL